jgi:hypothetical protein
MANFYIWNSRWKLNSKYKNIQTDASCTKLVVGLCYSLIILILYLLILDFINFALKSIYIYIYESIELISKCLFPFPISIKTSPWLPCLKLDKLIV